MNKLSFFAIMVIASTFYGSSCTKVNVLGLNSDMVNHFYYKPGSYWVYRDTVSGNYDSFSVENSRNVNVNESNTQAFQQIQTTILDQTNNSYNLLVSLELANELAYRFAINNNIFTAPIFTYPIGLGSSDYITKYDSSIIINGKIYNNTMEIYNNIDFSYYYINDSVGVIRVILYDYANSINIVWELVRFKIII